MAPTKKHLTMVDKAKALAWKETKMTYKEIAARLHCSLSSIERLFSKAKDSDGIPTRKKGSGSPKKVTKEMENIIRKTIEENPKLTSQEIINKNKKLCNISTRTVRRILKEKLGLNSYVAVEKPLLTQDLKKKRLAFAKKYSHWTKHMWHQVIFSDETKKNKHTSFGTRVRRKKGSDNFLEKYVQTKVKQSESLMIWASISCKGPGLIYFLEKIKKINNQEYINILEKKLQKSMKKTNTNILLHDKATVHTSKLTSNYLNRNNIKTITLPGCSPDLNPIENIFSDLKKQLARENISSVKGLEKRIRNFWSKLQKPYLTKLVNSIPNRLQEVIRRNGGMTKY